MPNKCKQFEAGFGSQKGLLLRSRQNRKRTPHEASSLIPHGYYFLFYCFLYAPRVSVASLLQAYTYIRACIRVELACYNASADTHNVIVKAFYIDPREKRNDRYLQIRGKRRQRATAKNYQCDAYTTHIHVLSLALSRAIRSDGSLNESANNSDHKFGFR